MQVDEKMIPEEAVEAAARAMCATDGFDPDAITDNHTPTCPGPTWRLWMAPARAAISAALAAWPEAELDAYPDMPHLILPLQQEKSDD